MRKESNKENKPKKNIFISILILISFICSGFFIYQISLLGPIEPLIRYIVIGILILINFVLFIRFIRLFKHPMKKHKRNLFIVGIIFFIIANILFGGVIYYFYSKLDSFSKDYITYSTSLVTKLDNEIKSIDDVHDLTIGIINDQSSTEGYVISQDIIKENKLNEKNTLKEYDDFSSMLSALYHDDIDMVFLSSNYATMFASIPGFEDIANTTKVIVKKEKQLKNEDSGSINQNKTSSVTEPFTILLMGVDSEINGMNKNAAFNGDSLMLVTFNPKTLNATMLSIPRDSYVPIACFPNKKENKITHAAWNGASCMMKTIENFTGIKIDYYAKVNFKAVVSLVDAMGGVDIDVEYSFCEQNSDRKFGNSTVYVKKGFQNLKGEQALAYSRNRHGWPQYCSKEWNLGERSDIVRGLHQQEVVEALLGKLKDVRSIDKVLELFNLVGSNLDTNMTTNEILSFYNIGKDILAKGINDSGEVISFQKLFLKTSGQMIYDESMRLVLSDQIIHQDSLKDVKDAMMVNLGLKDAKTIKKFSFSINDPYEELLIGNGKYGPNKLYNLLPNLVGKTKAQAELWGSQNGIKIIFANDGNGTVISQNFPANKRLDLIANKTVTLTLSGGSNTDQNSKIDCSIDSDNKTCEMPDFVGKTKTTVNSWLNKIAGVTIKYNEVEVGTCTATGNSCKVGVIIKQSITYGTPIKGTKTITLTIVVNDETKPTPSPSPSPKPNPSPSPTVAPEI